MPEKIVQLNEEVIKGQIKELAYADLRRFPSRARDAHPHQQRHRTPKPGDPPTHTGRGLFP